MAYRSSGNATVDAMSAIAITGNVVPQEWYKSVLRPNGKPHLLAISILADIVYWYRPTELRDEATGDVIGWKKRFKGDSLQKSYQQYADVFGESKRTIKNAMDALEDLGVIRKGFFDITLADGRIVNNQMFIELFPETLLKLSYPAEGSDGIKADRISPARMDSNADGTNEWADSPYHVRSFTGVVLKPESQPVCADDQNDTHPLQGTQSWDRPVRLYAASTANIGHEPDDLPAGGGTDPCKIIQGDMKNAAGGGEKSYRRVVKNSVPPPEKSCRTNTENTTEITSTESYPSIYPQNPDFSGTEFCSVDVDNQRIGCDADLERSAANPRRDAVGNNGIGCDADSDRMAANPRRDNAGKNKSGGNVALARNEGIDDDDAVLSLVRENIEYDWHMAYDDPTDASAFDELYRVIEDTIRGHPTKIRIGGMEFAYEVIKSRLLKLTGEHLDYVRSSIASHTGAIRNMKKYMLASLYNAPVTMGTYFRQLVNHDMYGGGWEDKGVV